MQNCWLHKEGRKKLVLFCNGWGMDERPFQMLKSMEYDVLCLYDYRQLTDFSPFDMLVEKYTELSLVSWSMGVWAGQKLFNKRKEHFQQTIAINGTLCPKNDNYGIPEEIFIGTLKQFDDKKRAKFYFRMCHQKKLYQTFIANQPKRTIAEQVDELRILADSVDCQPESMSIYDQIIISDHDLIMPTVNQRNFWRNSSVILVPGFHYIFNSWQSWDELLDFAQKQNS